MNILSKLLQDRFGRIIFLLSGLLAAFGLLVTLAVNEFKKQDIRDSQIKVEQNRLLKIDEELNKLYRQIYSRNTNDSNGISKAHNLAEIDFLKKQKIEATTSIDEISKNPDTQILVFTVIIITLTGSIIVFFTNSFRKYQPSISSRAFYVEDKRLRKSGDFLNWITNSELPSEGLMGLDLVKAKQLKEIYDLSESLGDNRDKLLSSVIQYTKIKRSQDEIEDSNNSNLYAVFHEMQNRLKDESDRLNRQALINLFLCFFIAFILMAFIAYSMVFTNELKDVSTMTEFAIRYIPKIISALSLLTMFLYFTRLYKTNIIDVRYYHNEITNIESRLVAVKLVSSNGDKDSLVSVMKDFMIIERNSILNKEQTTVELEKSKVENAINKDYLDRVWDLLKMSTFSKPQKEKEENS